MKKKKSVLWMLFSVGILLTASCSKGDNNAAQPDPQYRIGSETAIFSTPISGTLDSVVVQNLPADPSTRSLKDGHEEGADNRFTFFRFSDSTIVLYDSTASPRDDSASQKWDIAFRGTEILLNSGVHGPGEVEGQVKGGTFDQIDTAPENGYGVDEAEGGNVFLTWYNYNPDNHVITAKPGRIFLIHTNDDKYVKMEILGYYQGMPKNPSIHTHQRYYTFRYVIQQDGSRSFTK